MSAPPNQHLPRKPLILRHNRLSPGNTSLSRIYAGLGVNTHSARNLSFWEISRSVTRKCPGRWPQHRVWCFQWAPGGGIAAGRCRHVRQRLRQGDGPHGSGLRLHYRGGRL